jgi:hypothetical protein
MYIGKVQRAVEGRVISLIKAWPSDGYGYFNCHSLHCLSMRNFYLIFQVKMQALPNALFGNHEGQQRCLCLLLIELLHYLVKHYKKYPCL